MKKLVYSSLLALLSFSSVLAQEFYPLSPSEYRISETTLPEFHTSIEVGGAAQGTHHRVSILYPEYRPLTHQEIKSLKRQGFTPPSHIAIKQRMGVHQKRRILNVSFIPLVQQSGKWLRLVSCKIEHSPLPITLSRQSTRADAPTPANRYAPQSVLSMGKWVKIRVEKEGVYQITRQQIASMGFSDLSKVKLYGSGGQMLPQVFSFSGSDALADDLQEVPLYRRQDALLFFSEGVVSWKWNINRWTHENNPYSSYAYYFLTEGEAPATFPTLPAVEQPQATTTTIVARAVYEKDSYSWFPGGREFVDSYNFAHGNKKSFRVKLPGIVANSTAKIDVSFTAANISNSTAVNIQANDQALGSMLIGTHGDYQNARLSIRQYATNALTEESTFAFTTTAGHNARLDYIRVSYERMLSALDNGYAFTLQTTDKTALQISHANENTRLWRIGNGNSSVAEVKGQLSGTTYTANIEDPTRQYVIVDVAASYPTPTIVGKVANQNLHGHTAADMIILLPPSGKFHKQAAQLAAAHEKEGLRVRLVNAGEIYNEFSSGTPDIMAYRRYLKMLYDRAKTPEDAPKYLLLFGDALWDNRRITPETQSLPKDDYLLAYEKNNGYSTTDFFLGTLNSYVTDDVLGLLDDTEGATPEAEYMDIAIGRFPCDTEEEANTLVNKTLAYMNNKEVGTWKNTISFLADEGDNNLHMAGAERVIRQMHLATDSLFIIKKFYWDAYARSTSATGNNYPEVTRLIKEQMKRGSLIFNYMGHGSPHQISHSQLLKTSDFEHDASHTAPLWIFASCEITPYDQLEEDLGRVSLFNKKGGAVALLCASRAVYAGRNTSLNVAFAKNVLTEGKTLGEAFRLAKVEMVKASLDRSDNKMKYCLFADPALRLKKPIKGVIIDSINGLSVDAFSTQKLSAGSLVRFSGHIEEGEELSKDFTGTVTATIFDREETITCKNNKGDASAPLQYQDRGEPIYQGTDSVHNGRFTIRMVIPRSISYTNDRGRIILYAVNKDRSKEFNGANSQFYLNGTNVSSEPDTIRPKLFVYLNTPDFPNGGIVGTTALFGAKMSDNAGISASGAIGHKMELIIDNNYADAIPMNEYFSYDFGSYQSGTVQYPLANLSKGKHQLTFRVWDVNDNSTTSSLDFFVGDVKEYDIYASEPTTPHTQHFVVSHPETTSVVEVEVYDLLGKKIWSRSVTSNKSYYTTFTWSLTFDDGAPLPAGIYLYQARITDEQGEKLTEAKKILLKKQ